VFHGPRCLARYNTDGQLIETGRAHLPRKGPAHASNGPPIVDPRPMVRTKFRHVAERLESKNRTDHVLHTGQAHLRPVMRCCKSIETFEQPPRSPNQPTASRDDPLIEMPSKLSVLLHVVLPSGNTRTDIFCSSKTQTFSRSLTIIGINHRRMVHQSVAVNGITTE
jgi:hypothetical protein